MNISKKLILLSLFGITLSGTTIFAMKQGPNYQNVDNQIIVAKAKADMDWLPDEIWSLIVDYLSVNEPAVKYYLMRWFALSPANYMKIAQAYADAKPSFITPARIDRIVAQHFAVTKGSLTSEALQASLKEAFTNWYNQQEDWYKQQEGAHLLLATQELSSGAFMRMENHFLKKNVGGIFRKLFTSMQLQINDPMELKKLELLIKKKLYLLKKCLRQPQLISLHNKFHGRFERYKQRTANGVVKGMGFSDIPGYFEAMIATRSISSQVLEDYIFNCQKIALLRHDISRLERGMQMIQDKLQQH